MKKVRWGIIGCGDVTEKKSGPGFQKVHNSELVAVMRRNGKLAEDYAKRHNVPKWFDDAELIINDSDVNAIYIATPPSTHMKYTLDAAKAGKPVYVEKPMGMNYAECEKMIKACEDANVPLFVAYYRRALPNFLKIKSLIDELSLGKILCVNISYYAKPSQKDEDKDNWRVKPEIAGCGYFCDLASHAIDLLQYYLGDIVSATGFSGKQKKRYTAEDIVSAIFNFENGVQGTGIWCFNAEENLDRVEIVGSEGKINFPVFSGEAFHFYRNNKIETYNIQYPAHVQQPLIQTIVDYLTGNGKSPSTGKSGAKTNWVMDKILGRIK
jgi:predicted dehydrogenase